MMTQEALPFQYESEKNPSGLTGFAGLPLYIELAIKSDLVSQAEKALNAKSQGWKDVEILVSLMLLNLAGGDCISDIERLEQDVGLNRLLCHLATHGMTRQQRRAYERRWRKSRSRALPSNAAIHRWLRLFHNEAQESQREAGKAFIPAQNEALSALLGLNRTLVEAAYKANPMKEATLDQDATLSATHKRNAFYSYKKFKAYQPFNTYWSELGIVLHSEFRDGNVPAGYEQLRLFETSLSLLPSGVEKVFLRSDSAGYQVDLLRYCAEGKNERFGVIDFAVAAKVSGEFKARVLAQPPSAWQPVVQTEEDGTEWETTQEWAEVDFVPSWAAQSRQQPNYRFIAMREKMDGKSDASQAQTLPFQTIEIAKTHYKLFGLVTNREGDGNAIIQWHRARCGKSEQVHHDQKSEFAGGQFPSNLFGVNAAWWAIMLLSMNLNRLMQLVALPKTFQQSRMKALRFHVIQLPGRLIRHARQWFIRVGENVRALYQRIRERISRLGSFSVPEILNTS